MERPGALERAGPARVRRPSESKEAILSLQRSAGNRAVTRLLQREAAFGLRTKAEVSGFAGPAVAYWQANKSMSLQDFGAHLMSELNVQLAANGVPALPVPKIGAAHHRAGGFRHAGWNVDLNLGGIAQQPITAAIGTLTADQVAEVAGVCYHEVRHAEQIFTVARMLATRDKKDAKTIAAEIEIPINIATAAVNATGALPDKASMVEVEQWRAFAKGGRHHDYWEWNEHFRGFAANVVDSFADPGEEGVDSVTAAWSKLTPTLAGWKKDSLPVLVAKIDSLAGVRAPDASDRLVLRDAKKIRAGIDKVMKADKALGDKVAWFQTRKAAAATKPITVSEAKVIQLDFAALWIDVRLAVTELMITCDKAYAAYPDEADSYAVEASVMKEFKAKAAAGAPRP